MQKKITDSIYYNNDILWLKKKLDNKNYNNISKCNKLALVLYEKGYSGLNIMNYIEQSDLENTYKYKLLIYLDKIRKEFRNEKIFMFIILYYLLLRKNITLENIISI